MKKYFITGASYTVETLKISFYGVVVPAEEGDCTDIVIYDCDIVTARGHIIACNFDDACSKLKSINETTDRYVYRED